MAKDIYLTLGQIEEIADVGRALSVPIRVKILSLINKDKLSIADIARELGIPASSCAAHIKALQKADLVRIEQLPGTRGSVKICSRNVDKVTFRMVEPAVNVNEVIRVEMPVGAYTDCKVSGTCGLADVNGLIGMDDGEENFYLPEHIHADFLWIGNGYVEYAFPNKIFSLPFKAEVGRISLSAELCSEAPGFNMDWKSDITLWLNGVDCGTWTCNSDYGQRKGLHTPEYWSAGRTQYGELTQWEVTTEGTFINQKRVSDTVISDLHIMDSRKIKVRIGNKENAKHAGGFNLFGKNFGDYSQDIVMGIGYTYTS